MLRPIILLIIVISFTSVVFAENCPSVAEVKAKTLKGWQARDSDDDTPLPPKRLAEFFAHIEQFALAEWKELDGKHSTMHCYYRDKEGSELESYLSKQDLSPINNKHLWYQVSGSLHCAAGNDACLFTRNAIAKQPKLAKI